MRFCCRQMIKARVRYVKESQWWRENKGCKIGKSLEDFERDNIRDAAKAYRIQLGKLKKNPYRREIIWYNKDMRKFINCIKQYRGHPDSNSLPVCLKDEDFVTLLFRNPDLFFAELDFKYTAQYYRRYVRRGEK